MSRTLKISIAALLILSVAVIAYKVSFAHEAPTHNEHGGYIDACGDLPGLVGDDC